MAKTKKQEEPNEPPAEVSTPPQEVADVVITPSVVSESPNKILVDKLMFFKIFKTCVLGYGNQLNKGAAVTKFGQAMGGTNPAEYKANWDMAQKYLQENK